jgi:subtilisin
VLALDDREVLTGRSLIVFDVIATEQDFRKLLAELELIRLESDAPWIDTFKIGVAPIRPEAIDFYGVACRFKIKRIEPERVQQPPVTGLPSVQDPGFDHLKLLKANKAKCTGNGIKIAILDSGFEFDHPDFRGRTFLQKTFVGNSAYDENGHGTHCTGLACGPRRLGGGPGYGVAEKCVILVVRVADKNRLAKDADILLGLEWAGQQHADVISLSFNSDSASNEPSAAYERAGRVLLGLEPQLRMPFPSLVIGSAGNGGGGGTGPVQEPANCNAIMAVGSVDRNLAPSDFSPVLVPAGDPVDIVAPGCPIRSSWLLTDPRNPYRVLCGTSQAAPLAAGVAALWAEHNGMNCRGLDLWQAMIEGARPLKGLGFPRIGAGLVTAPTGPC